VVLRHTLATLGYRGAKVLRDAPAGFASFKPGDASRSAGQILAHMGDLMDWALSIAEDRQTWNDAVPQTWDADVRRFFEALGRFDACLASRELPPETAKRLFQGPIADALTHVGQLAMMRRLAGAPIRGENYFVAEIAAGRVSVDQPSPRREFA
jgi:hypothetical protein